MKVNQRMKLRAERLQRQNGMGFSLPSIFGGKDYSKMTDLSVGLDYITKFFNSEYFLGQPNPNVYIGALASKLGASVVNAQIAGLGAGIRGEGMSEGEVRDCADTLAEASVGRVPASIGAFRQALIDQATSTPFVDAIVDNAIIQATAKIGDTLISAAETAGSLVNSTVEGVGMMAKVLKVVPFVLPIAIGYGVYKFATSGIATTLIKKRLGV